MYVPDDYYMLVFTVTEPSQGDSHQRIFCKRTGSSAADWSQMSIYRSPTYRPNSSQLCASVESSVAEGAIGASVFQIDCFEPETSSVYSFSHDLSEIEQGVTVGSMVFGSETELVVFLKG